MNRSPRRARVILFTLLGVAALGVAGAGLAQHGRGRGMHELKTLDTDGDRALSRAEIEAGASARFAAIDANHDGQATVEEIRAYREQRRAERQAARLARIDSDGDGRISEAEFVARRLEQLQRLDRNDDGVLDARDRRRPRG